MKKKILTILIALLVATNIPMTIHAEEITNSIVEEYTDHSGGSEETVVEDHTTDYVVGEATDLPIDQEFQDIENNNIQENMQEDNQEVNQENVASENTPDGMQEITIAEGEKTGYVFIKAETAEDFNYQLKAVVINTDTNKQLSIPIYSTNDYIGKQKLPVGNYMLAEVSVPNDLKGEYQFKTGQTFQITDGSSVEVVSKQMELLEDKEEKTEEKQEVKKDTKEKRDNKAASILVQVICIIIVVAVVCAFIYIFNKNHDTSDE